MLCRDADSVHTAVNRQHMSEGWHCVLVSHFQVRTQDPVELGTVWKRLQTSHHCTYITRKDLSVRYDENQARMTPRRPNWRSIRCRSSWWSTVSKAAVRSSRLHVAINMIISYSFLNIYSRNKSILLSKIVLHAIGLTKSYLQLKETNFFNVWRNNIWGNTNL